MRHHPSCPARLSLVEACICPRRVSAAAFDQLADRLDDEAASTDGGHADGLREAADRIRDLLTEACGDCGGYSWHALACPFWDDHCRRCAAELVPGLDHSCAPRPARAPFRDPLAW